MKLPVDIFTIPYEIWETRDPTPQEVSQSFSEGKGYPHEIKVRIKETVSNPVEAVSYSVRVGGSDNAFEYFVDKQLEISQEYRELRYSMSSRTPQSISNYQNRYSGSRLSQVSEDIETSGSTVGVGTVLYHGGLCPADSGEIFITARPLSTTFCPQIALRNAVWANKAFDAGQIHMLILRIADSATKAFATRLKGTSKGHEKEVVFPSGVSLSVLSKKLLTDSYKITKVNRDLSTEEKFIPVYVFEVDVR